MITFPLLQGLDRPQCKLFVPSNLYLQTAIKLIEKNLCTFMYITVNLGFGRCTGVDGLGSGSNLVKCHSSCLGQSLSCDAAYYHFPRSSKP